jgi:hypothetical protein
MKNLIDADPRTIALVRKVDPLDDPRVAADAGLDADAALAALLARAESDAALAASLARSNDAADGSRGRPRPRRRAVQLGTLAAGVAVAAVVAANVGSSGDGGVSKALEGSGIGVSPARAEVLVTRARQALATAPAPGSVQRVVATSQKDGGPVVQSTTWTELGSPFDSRTVYSEAGGPDGESGQTNGQDEFFDPSTNTVYRETEPFPQQEAGQSPALSSALQFLRTPGLTVDREATLDGTAAIEATRREGDGSVSAYWFSKDTYEPLKFTNTDPTTGQGFVETYAVETLAGAAASGAPDSVSAEHPSATVAELPNARFVAKEVQVLGE